MSSRCDTSGFSFRFYSVNGSLVSLIDVRMCIPTDEEEYVYYIKGGRWRAGWW